MITCIKCNETKPKEAFQREKSRKSGYRGKCKECEKSTRKKYWSVKEKTPGDPSTIPHCKTPLGQWQRHIKAKFGITEDVYRTLYDKQEGRCAICGTTETGSKHGFFSIDHCHTNGHIRGLLCKFCNYGLGHFKDNPDALRKAADYLQKA